MRRIQLIKNQLKSLETNTKDLILIETVTDNKVIKIVKMNNPKQLNALSYTFLCDLHAALIKLDRDSETKVIILTGINNVFSAGADIKYFYNKTTAQMNQMDALEPIENIFYQTNKPLIAAINGHCLGGGLELALSCDILLASNKANLAFPEIKLGMFPGAGGTQRFVRLLGYYKAMEYIFTGKQIDLNFAKDNNIISEIYENNEELLKNAVKLAENISKFSIDALIASKRASKLALETSLYAGIKTERAIFHSLFETEGKKKGIEAILNKNKKTT